MTKPGNTRVPKDFGVPCGKLTNLPTWRELLQEEKGAIEGEIS